MEFTFTLPNGVKGSSSMGSILHGAIMELLPSDVQQWLHEYSRRPYSQYLYFDTAQQAFIWRIASLTKVAYANVLMPLYQMPETLYLKQKGVPLTITDRKWLVEDSYEGLTERFLGSDTLYRKVHLQFKTGTSFKNEGQYMIYPDLGLLYKNLLRRWNTFSDNEIMDDPVIVKELLTNTQVSTYKLMMSPFSLEQTRIPAFRGQLTVSTGRVVMIRRIAALLGYYANFSGVGIKTALGMGGTQVLLEE